MPYSGRWVNPPVPLASRVLPLNPLWALVRLVLVSSSVAFCGGGGDQHRASSQSAVAAVCQSGGDPERWGDAPANRSEPGMSAMRWHARRMRGQLACSSKPKSKPGRAYLIVPCRLRGTGYLDHRPDLESVIPSLKRLGLHTQISCMPRKQMCPCIRGRGCACAGVWAGWAR